MSVLRLRRSDVRRFTLRSRGQFDLAPAEPAPPAGCRHELSRQHEGVRPERLARLAKRLTHVLAAKTFEIHVNPALRPTRCATGPALRCARARRGAAAPA